MQYSRATTRWCSTCAPWRRRRPRRSRTAACSLPYNYQDLLLHNLLLAGDSGRLTKVKAVLKKLEINGVSLKSRAYDLDLKTCAKE